MKAWKVLALLILTSAWTFFCGYVWGLHR